MFHWTRKTYPLAILAVSLIASGHSTCHAIDRITVSRDGGSTVLAGPEFRVVVDDRCGLPARVESMIPSIMPLWNGSERKVHLAVESRDGSWDRQFDRLVSFRVWKGKDSAGSFAAAKSELEAEGIEGSASLEVKVYADRLSIDGSVRLDGVPTGPVSIRLSQPFESGLWERQIFYEPQGRVRPVSPDQLCLRKYGDHVNDRVTDDYPFLGWSWLVKHLGPWTEQQWKLDNIGYPRGILQARDRYLLYGSLDINGYAILAQNWRGECPCFLRMPRTVSPGDTFSFSICYKIFPRGSADLSDVSRWYARNIRSSNELSKGLVTLGEAPMPRTLPFGNVMAGSDLKKGPGIDMPHVWFVKHDELPEPGSAEDKRLMAEIKSLQSQCLNVYAYFRQLALAREFHRDRPRYRDWALVPRKGMIWAWAEGPMSAAEALEADLGLAEDFCNNDFVEWYIDHVKYFIDRYHPDGIAWDMGWDVYISPCFRHQSSGIHHGILRVQKEIYDYIKRNYPAMRVILNESVGSPSMLYCDAVMSEDGTGIGAEMMANADCYRISMTGLYYVWLYKKLYDTDWEGKYIHDVMHNLSLGFTWGCGDFDAVVSSQRLMSLKELAAFSAAANSLPRVIEKAGLHLGSTDQSLSGRVWAGGNRLLSAIFNDSNEAKSINAVISGKVLAGKNYRHRSSKVPALVTLGKDGGAVRTECVVSRAGEDLVITGLLPAGSLLLMESN